MKQLKFIYVVLAIMAIDNFANAQKRNLDSLYKIINTTSDEKVAVGNLIHVWWWYFQEQNHVKSLEIINKANKMAFAIGDSDLIVKASGNIGFQYKEEKNYGAAIYNFKQAEKHIPFGKRNYKVRIILLGNLAECYYNIGEYEIGKTYTDSSIAINKIMQDQIQGFFINTTLARYYFEVKNYNEGFKIMDSALKTKNIDLFDLHVAAFERLNYIFKTYYEDTSNNKKWLQLSKTYLNEYINIFEMRGSNVTQLEQNRDWVIKARYFLMHNDLKSAEENCKLLYEKNKGNLSPEFNVTYLRLRFIINAKTKNNKTQIDIFNALQYISDSVELALHKNNSQSIELLVAGQTQLETEKLQKEEKILLANQSKKQTRLTVVFGSIILFILIIGILILRNRFIAEKQQKLIISKQKELVDEKQKEITDSINYAKRIQSAMMAPEFLMNEKLQNYFLYFNPKDIVSGDFYWACNINDYFFIAICDSTGHGIPGSFMSLINISYLNEAINEKHILEPNQVFDYVRKRLIETLSNEGQKDGFDGILLRLNFKQNELVYAAANNAPIHIKNSNATELEKDRMPVGKGEKEKQFTQHTVILEKGDMIYAFTDGYADQFGGEAGKKYKKKNLIELLTNNWELNMSEQKAQLSKTYSAWRGTLEQVDDVCVFGFKV